MLYVMYYMTYECIFMSVTYVCMRCISLFNNGYEVIMPLPLSILFYMNTSIHCIFSAEL